MGGRKEYEYQKIDRATERQDEWYLQRRREIREEEDAIQTKMEISQPGDVHEQEADMIANNVMSGGNANVNQLTPTGNNVQTKSENDVTQADSDFKEKLESAKAGGEYMEDSVRSEMESKMGADFSGVKIHTGDLAHELNKRIKAKAFTFGQNIFFTKESFDPDSLPEIGLLAHELAHTVQQKKGSYRKIQRLVSDADKDTIAGYIAPHLFRAREVKRNAVLSILSNEENTPEDITAAWKDPKLSKHLEYFVDSFKRVEDFDEYPMAIAATFSALDEKIRIAKIQSLVKRGITSNEAVRILYLMQGLSDFNLNLAFSLDPPDSSPTKYDLFKMALPPAETDRLNAAYEHSSNLLVNLQAALKKAQDEKDEVKIKKLEKQIKDLQDNDQQRKLEIIKTAYKVCVALDFDTDIFGKAGMEHVKKRKHLLKEIKKKTVEPYQAIVAYRFIKDLYAFSPVAEEEFGYEYPELYNYVMENLPVEFMHSPEFGMQTIHHDQDDVDRNAQAYNFLYTFSKPYRYLYNNPEAFANIMLLKGKVKLDKKEDDKPYLFDERKTKVEAVLDSDQLLVSNNIDYLKGAAPDNFVPADEKDAFDAGLDAIFDEVTVPEDPMTGPMLTDPDWIYLPGTKEINKPYFLSMLSGLMDRILQKNIIKNKETQQANYDPEKDPTTQAKKYLDARPDLNAILIGSPLPVVGTNKQLAEELKDDDKLLDVYNQDNGIFQLLYDDTLWKDNARLDSALSLAIAGGLGDKIAGYVNTKKTASNQQILIDKGFVNGTYTPTVMSLTSTMTSTKLDIPAMLENLVTDQLISLHPKKKNKIQKWPRWRKYTTMLLRHPFKSIDLVKSGAYFLEGYYLPNKPFLNKIIGTEAHYQNLDLVSVQKGMGGQIFGMEFGSTLPSKDQALLNIDVDETNGIAVVSSSALNIKSMNMQYPDMLFTSGAGEFSDVYAKITWPPDRKSEDGSTLMTFASLELNDLLYKDNETLFSLGKIKIDGLTIKSDKPIANYTQMNNWYKLFFSVMQFIQDILALIMNGIQVSAQRYAPDMIKDITNPASDTGNPQKALSEFLLQRLSEGQKISIDYDELSIENMLINDMGLIKSFATGKSQMVSSNKQIGNTAEHQMYFGFNGDDLQINGANISGFKSKTMGAGTFGLGLYFSEPSDGVVKGRDMATLRSLSQLSVQNDPTAESKLKKMDFTLTDMTGDALTIAGLEMKTLPFTGVSGCIEFVDAVPQQGNTAAIPPKVHITLYKVTDVNFIELPYPADMSLRLISNADSHLTGDIVNADIMLTLNSEADQIENGWDIQKVEIISMTIPKLTGDHFSIVTQGSETKIDKGGTITNIVLSNFVMEHHKEEVDPWDIKTLSVATGGADMQGIGIKTAAGISATLNQFTSGSMNFGMVVTDSMDDGKKKEVTKYTYGATGVTTSGSISYTSPVDPFDASKKPITIGADLNMTNNTIGGTYTTTTLGGVTTGSAMTMTSTIQLLSIPTLNVTSDTLQIVAPEVKDHPILLDTISADVEVTFNEFGDATDFTIKSMKVNKISTYGLKMTDLVKNKTIVDVPETVESYISGFYITDMVMQKRKFTQYEIDEMRRDKKRTQMPDYNQTWDFNQTQGAAGQNKVGFESSNLPLGLKMAIGDSIGVEMTKATSGAAEFQFVSINEFSYSITDLDASGVKVTDDGKTIFRGDLDSNMESGTFKQEIIGTGDDAKKKITLTGTIDIPNINIHELNISSDTSLIEIPADATKTSTIVNAKGSYIVVITEPSENEKAAVKAKADDALKELNSGKKLSDKRKRELTEISKQEAKSEIEMTVTDMTIEKIQGYGLHIRSTSETNITQSTTPGGKTIDTYNSKTYELKLRKDTAATLNNIVMKDFKVVIPADDKKKITVSAGTPDKPGFTIGGQGDVPGIDIGTAEIFTSSVRNMLQGTQETTPPNVSNTNLTTSMQVKKLSFGGTTEGEYTITIDDPKFWFPKNNTGTDENVSSQTLNYDLDETDEYGAPVTKEHTSTSVLLNSLRNREAPVLSAKSIIISRKKAEKDGKPKLDKKGNPIFEEKVKIVDPILADLAIKLDNHNDKPGEVHDLEIFVGGDMTGTTLIIEEDEANFDEFQDKDPDKRKMESAIILRTEDKDSDITFTSAKVILNKNPKTERTDAENQALPEDDWAALATPGYRPSGKYNFLDHASGTISIGMFGEQVHNITLENATRQNGEVVNGLIDLAAVVEYVEHRFEGTDPYTTPKGQTVNVPRARRNPYFGLTQMQADFDMSGNYVLQSSSLDINSLILVPNAAQNVIQSADGRQLVRLSALVDYQANKPATRPAPPGSNADLASQDIHDMLNGLMQLTVTFTNVAINMSELTSTLPTVQAQNRSWLNVFTGDTNVVVNGTFDLNQDPETNPATWNTRKLGPQLTINNPQLPAFRYVLKEDKKVNAVVSGSQVNATTMSAKFDEINLEKLTLDAPGLKIKGFRYEQKK